MVDAKFSNSLFFSRIKMKLVQALFSKGLVNHHGKIYIYIFNVNEYRTNLSVNEGNTEKPKRRKKRNTNLTPPKLDPGPSKIYVLLRCKHVVLDLVQV